jgi:Mu transposase-like protein
VIHFDRNRYNVPASFANRPVSVRVYPERIVVAAEGQVICEHGRVFARAQEHDDRLRLAALPRGHSAQARSPAQWRAVRRVAASFPSFATAHA